MNTNIPEVGTQPSIYHGCSTWKMYWEEKFTFGEFTPVNMKNCGRSNVRKHKEIYNGEKYITLDISLKYGSLDNMKITSSDPKDYLVIPGKGLITSLDFKTIVISKGEKSQGMPLLMSVWRIFQRLSRSLKGFLIRFMCIRGPNMNPLTVTFIYQDKLLSEWWELVPSICTLTL